MITKEMAGTFAREWVEAWNRHDLAAILEHYAEDFEMASPFIALMAGEPGGTLRGKAAVGRYWEAALARVPDLKFDLLDVMAGVDSVVLVYRSSMGKTAAEVFVFNEQGKVARAAAHYRD